MTNATRYPTKAVACAVCGAQTNDHARWFLVVENRWLDHLKVLLWHPALADQRDIKSVCGEDHLRALIQHWLTQANLDLESSTPIGPILIESQWIADAGCLTGKLLGELAVDREPVTHSWTGSSQTLDCILSAITGNNAKTQVVDCPLPPCRVEPLSCTYAYSAGRT
jgi:hypothetical protein